MTQTFPDFISVQELPTYQQNGNVVLLDVRDEQSFKQNHLPDAVSINPQTLATDIQQLDDDKHYIVICYHGIMAVPVAELMKGHDLQASVLQGGMAAVGSQP